jgi:hypothetical protein
MQQENEGSVKMFLGGESKGRMSGERQARRQDLIGLSGETPTRAMTFARRIPRRGRSPHEGRQTTADHGRLEEQLST